MKKFCPCVICGSRKSAFFETVTQTAKAPFGTPVEYRINKIKCEACGESYNLSAIKELRAFNKAYAKSTRDSIPEMISNLIAVGFSPYEIDRCVQLPTGTINKWLDGKKISAEGVALLRILRNNPKLIREAEKW